MLQHKLILALPVFLALMIGPAPVDAQSAKKQSSAQAFVETLAEKTMATISNPDITRSKRRQIFSDMLRDHFAMETISRFALGRYWRVTTPEQKKRYRSLLNEALINVYTDRFDEYRGERFQVTGQYPSGNDTIITSEIIPPNQPQVKVDWRIRKKNGEFKIIDVIVQDISMVVTKRSDFASVIQRGGGNVEVLLKHLEEDQENLL